jgi:ankyrin repeat protein
MQVENTALMMASMNGRVNVVQCLVEAGANLEAVNEVS